MRHDVKNRRSVAKSQTIYIVKHELVIKRDSIMADYQYIGLTAYIYIKGDFGDKLKYLTTGLESLQTRRSAL